MSGYLWMFKDQIKIGVELELKKIPIRYMVLDGTGDITIQEFVFDVDQPTLLIPELKGCAFIQNRAGVPLFGSTIDNTERFSK